MISVGCRPPSPSHPANGSRKSVNEVTPLGPPGAFSRPGLKFPSELPMASNGREGEVELRGGSP